MKRGGPIKRKRKKPTTEEERAAMLTFKAQGIGEPCLMALRPDHDCAGPMEQHHLIKKSWLKADFKYVDQPYLFVWAPEIGVSLCQSGHERVTNHVTRIWWHEVPEVAREWAKQWGCLWRLELECPFFTPSDR